MLKKIEKAYSNDFILNKHLDDLKVLHDEIRKNHQAIYFVVFPFLNNENSIDFSSSLYIEKMKKFFSKTCRNGDVFFDVSALARDLGPQNSVVSFLNSHASSNLNSALADEIAMKIGVINTGQSRNVNSMAVFPCTEGSVNRFLKRN